METTITFHVTKEDKEKLFEFSRSKRLCLSSFCRSVLINFIKEKAEVTQNAS